mmetsp:Transcript_38718/g.122003  ORF Transcript_38718/g.122003 Transcript_38718/m.122003 type:complete len:437 (+) Transcript_38718:136-1446(+)
MYRGTVHTGVLCTQIQMLCRRLGGQARKKLAQVREQLGLDRLLRREEHLVESVGHLVALSVGVHAREDGPRLCRVDVPVAVVDPVDDAGGLVRVGARKGHREEQRGRRDPCVEWSAGEAAEPLRAGQVAPVEREAAGREALEQVLLRPEDRAEPAGVGGRASLRVEVSVEAVHPRGQGSLVEPTGRGGAVHLVRGDRLRVARLQGCVREAAEEGRGRLEDAVAATALVREVEGRALVERKVGRGEDDRLEAGGRAAQSREVRRHGESLRRVCPEHDARVAELAELVEPWADALQPKRAVEHVVPRKGRGTVQERPRTGLGKGRVACCTAARGPRPPHGGRRGRVPPGRSRRGRRQPPRGRGSAEAPCGQHTGRTPAPTALRPRSSSPLGAGGLSRRRRAHRAACRAARIWGAAATSWCSRAFLAARRPRRAARRPL